MTSTILLEKLEEKENPNKDLIEIVLDTNIVVSAAIIVEGSPAKIFEMVLSGKIKNYTSQEILQELKKTMQKKRIRKRLSEQQINFIIKSFEKTSEIIAPDINLEIINEDPDDNKFLECAVSAQADYIISGDEHLLQLKEFQGIKILTPKDFVELFEDDY